ncbi:hypothetical protein MKX03_019633, partial [Papaver bracteatum]
TNQEFDIQLPKHNFPSQILYRVIYVQLKAELETDEVKRCLVSSQELMARDFHGLEWYFLHMYRDRVSFKYLRILISLFEGRPARELQRRKRK